MNAQRKRAIVASLLLILSSLAGCLGDDLEDSVDESEAGEAGVVLVSTYHVGELVSAVGGDLVELEMMSTMNIPVHDYEPSAQDLIRLNSADVFLYHGLGLEPWVEGAIADLPADGPLVAGTHAMPSGETSLDYESLLISKLCTSLNSPGTTDVNILAEHAEDAEELHSDDAAHNMAFPEDDHDEEHHDEEDHHDEDDHDEDDHDEDGHDDGHDEHDHGDHEQVQAEETIQNPAGCPTNTVITVYHFEEGEYVLEFEAESMETFSMAIAAMGGAHHHHDHGAHGDEHGDEHGVCHDMSTHENHDEYESEETCKAAGYMWVEGQQHDEGHGVCHDEDTHENHDEYETEETCEAAGHHWMEGDHDDGPETPAEALEMFDTNNDSFISLSEFIASMEDDDEEHDHGDHDDDHESHHNVALVYPDGTSAMVDVEHDTLPENATGWNLTTAAMVQSNITVNSTYGTFGNYVSGIAGFEAPDDSSWYWELHTWNATSDAWETSNVGVDAVMVGHDTDHIAWAPNSTDDSTIAHPEEGHDDHDEHDDHEHEIEMAMYNFLFGSADANSDGLLNTTDLETLMVMMEDTEDYLDADAMVSIYFDVFDEDENGLISIGEFTEMMSSMDGDDDHDDHDDHDGHDDGDDHDSNGTSDGHDDHNETEMVEMMFTIFDTNEDGSLNTTELHAMMNMGEDEHEEGVAFIGLHVDEEGDYGIALPAGVTMHVLMGSGHDDHDHGDHDDHGDEDGDDHDDHGDEDSGDHGDEEGDDHDDHGDEDGDDHDGHADEEIAFDPHSWLDPVAFAAQVEIVYETLSTAFPEHADSFRANADAYKAELLNLDEGFTAAFGENGTCSANKVAANHNAYAYISQRYGVEFVTVHGLDPEGEPSPEDIAEVVKAVEEDGITVLFVEEYTDASAVASLVQQTVSDDLPDGVSVLTLYTMEMAPSDSADDYISMMKKNLENLKTGLGC